MSDDHGNCPDCGGSDGWHYSDCVYDGTGGGGYRRSSKRPSGGSGNKFIFFFILALLIGYGFNELIGTIIMIILIICMILS